MAEFNFGDRVILTKDRDCATRGMKGTIIAELEYGDYGVKFDEPFDGGHNLEGRCQSKYGHWIAPDQMRLLDDTNSAEKFKAGDIVKGTRSNKYGVTNSHMTRGRVTEVGEDGMLSVRVLEHDDQYWVGHDFYCLDPKDFELASSIEKPEFRVGQRVRIRSFEALAKEFGDKNHSHRFPVRGSVIFNENMECLCGRAATITELPKSGDHIQLENWSDESGDTNWNFLTEMLEPADFEVGQIYRVGKLSHRREWENAIIKLTGSRPYGFNVKSIRGEAPFDFASNSEYARSLTLLTGPQIGEAIKKYDADHAEKKSVDSSEYIKIVHAILAGQGYKNGDIFRVTATYCPFEADVHVDGISGMIDGKEYVVLEGYSPVKEVKRKATIGEYVKVLDDRGGPVKSGTIWRVKSIDSSDGYLGLEDDVTTWNCSYGHYVVLEGYKPEQKGKHVYTYSEIDVAKKFVLNTIRNLAEEDTCVIFSHSSGDENDNSAFSCYILDDEAVLYGIGGGIRITGAKQYKSICSENDEPNEWVGKAVALCKALDLPLPAYVL